MQKYAQIVESLLERFLFASRWLLAPFYVGLALALVILMVKFCEEFFRIAVGSLHATESQVILGVLSLVDLTLTGSLIVIVVFSGYENFVSKIDHTDHEDWPEWMGTIDFTALKLKLLSSIVAISAVQLLKQFMSLQKVSQNELFWYVVIHLVFVVSSVLLALSDRIAGHNGHATHAPAHKPTPRGTEEPREESKVAIADTQPPTGHGESHSVRPGAGPQRRK